MTEMALTLTVVMMLVVGVLDLGRAFFVFISLRDAAQEGALFGSYNPKSCSGINTRVRETSNKPVNLFDSHVKVDTSIIMTTSSGVITVSCPAVTWPVDPCAGDEVLVSVTYDDFQITTPFLGSLIGKQALDIKATVRDTVLVPTCPIFR